MKARVRAFGDSARDTIASESAEKEADKLKGKTKQTRNEQSPRGQSACVRGVCVVRGKWPGTVMSSASD